MKGQFGVRKIPIQFLRKGHLIFDRRKKLHKVNKIVQRHYKGQIIIINLEKSYNSIITTPTHLILSRRIKPLKVRFNSDKRLREKTRKRAKELRKNLTHTERLLWNALRNRNLGVKFRRQHPVGPYIADFYSPEIALVIEIDGDSHSIPGRRDKDIIKDKFLKDLDIDVIRIFDSEIIDNLDGVIWRIDSIIKKRGERVKRLIRWCGARKLRTGDRIISGEKLESVRISGIENMFADEEVYDIDVISSDSIITEACVIHAL
ncbi:MAG: endonuclease domain-containing protein [Candidatus Eremiobacteraeota bacterium]|nr:endonuclease domain-containing protein [Candidatus Eremiobacteraeota bacterium]